MKNSILLGVDIGGSHISTGVVDLGQKDLVAGTLQRVPVDSSSSVDEIIDLWSQTMFKSMGKYSKPMVVSIAMPGPFDYEKGISWIKGVNKYEQLYGLNIKELLLEKLGSSVSDIFFINDATCFLQGEISCGAAVGYKHVAGFTLGTGFGSATSENYIVEDGNYWCAPFLGKTCEDYFSTRWFVKKYSNLYGSEVRNVKDIIDYKEAADPMLHVFDEFALNMGLFLMRLHRERRCDCIIIGGNISKASMFFIPQVKAYLEAYSIKTPIFISELGENAALIGAASYAYSNN